MAKAQIFSEGSVMRAMTPNTTVTAPAPMPASARPAQMRCLPTVSLLHTFSTVGSKHTLPVEHSFVPWEATLGTTAMAYTRLPSARMDTETRMASLGVRLTAHTANSSEEMTCAAKKEFATQP